MFQALEFGDMNAARNNLIFLFLAFRKAKGYVPVFSKLVVLDLCYIPSLGVQDQNLNIGPNIIIPLQQIGIGLQPINRSNSSKIKFFISLFLRDTIQTGSVRSSCQRQILFEQKKVCCIQPSTCGQNPNEYLIFISCPKVFGLHLIASQLESCSASV